MEYEVEYRYSDKKTKLISYIYLHFERVLIWICPNFKYHYLDIHVRKQENCKDKCKKFDIALCLISLMLFLEQNQLFCEKDGQTFKRDILKVENVKAIYISDLELWENDCLAFRQFPKLKWIETKNCTIYENCNLGSLKCNYRDDSSLIYNLDSFNGFEGEYFCLNKSKIKNCCKNVLHLNSIVAKLDQVNMDYEHFFLTTDAPKMRKLEIYSNPRLKNNDLLFISGFYNLESVQIEGDVSSYEQVKKLEKLRELRYLFCTDKKELEATKEKRRKAFATYFGNKSLEVQKDYLMTQRMIIQNHYQKFFHELYVPRLERVIWQDEISSYDLEQIKQELETIALMSRKERRKLAREPKKEYNFFDSLNELWFDGMPKQEEDDECYLVNSNPNPNPFDLENKGIDYYVLKRKIYLEE